MKNLTDLKNSIDRLSPQISSAISAISGTNPGTGEDVTVLVDTVDRLTDQLIAALGGGSNPGLAPVITSPLTANGVAGQAFSYQIVAKNSPETLRLANLPVGLGDNGNGSISGVLQASGNFTIALSAVNQYGSDNKNLILTVQDAGSFRRA